MKDKMDKVTEIYNFRAIEDALSTSGQPTEAQLQAAAAEGYEVIINLALHDDPKYSLPDETSLVEGLGMKYVHIPVQFDAPREDDLLAFFQVMEIYKDKKIHIHCAANMRVTAFLGLYRTIKQGQAKVEAFKTMKSVWEPNDVWSSFISGMVAKYAQQDALADRSTAMRFHAG
jgi:protein tyrosine phosphatase (PTP) superfamily phosphohydrolase (DUF442 family)